MLNDITILGLMSGTSCDGLDIALCSFNTINEQYTFKLINGFFLKYDNTWINKLKNASQLSGYDLIKLHREYGIFIGNAIKEFCKETSQTPNYIASHGHTIFHEPKNKLNFQLGDGAAIAASSGIQTICDFRSANIIMGGQGAPLVPIGDVKLFNQYDACLNLGGFSNISYQTNNKIIAYDICPVNFLLNYFSRKAGFDYDKNGELGKQGNPIKQLLEQLNKIEYYQALPPKSLSEEWINNSIMPILNNYERHEINDLLATIYRHIAEQIANSVNLLNLKNLLITGGGAHNSYLISLLKNACNTEIVIPNKKIIDFKEAIIFAFLGYLFTLNKPNCLASVTGTNIDHIGGTLYKT